MKPKGKLFALFAVFTAIGLVTATGAFTTVQAERTATLATADDADALLGLAPNASHPNGAYAASDGGELTIDVSDQGNGFDGQGVNENAITELDHVFDITNQGTQEVRVWINSSQDGITFYDSSDGSSIHDAANGVDRSPGEHVSVGIQIDLINNDVVLDSDITITVHADADEVDAS